MLDFEYLIVGIVFFGSFFPAFLKAFSYAFNLFRFGHLFFCLSFAPSLGFHWKTSSCN